MSEVALEAQQEKQDTTFYKKHYKAVTTGLSLLFILLAYYAGQKDLHEASIVLYILAYISGGFETAREGISELINEREIDVDLLMIIAAIGAASIGYWMDGAILIFIFSLSGAMESYTMAQANKSIRSIMKLRPESATLLADGRERQVRALELKKGDLILVKPGERIATDGIVLRGFSSVDQSSITGESIPVDKAAGDEVFSSTINLQGALTIEVSKPSEETMFAKIINLVEEAQNEKPQQQQFVERFERVYARVIIVLAVILMFAPHYFLGWSWNETIYRAMIFLIVASPCALVASIMPVILSGISNATRKGVLFKGGVHLENMGAVKVVAFDKTGTLTAGKPKVMDVVPFNGVDSKDLLRAAATMESLSQHPIAKAVLDEARRRGCTWGKPELFEAIHGMGVTSTFGGHSYMIGKEAILKDVKPDDEQLKQIRSFAAQGKTVIYVTRNGMLMGIITVQDRIRQQARHVVNELHKLGVKVAMLTGDSLSTAKAIGEEARVDHVHAELLPQQKVEVIKELSQRYGPVAMVGDGVNDAPALATATVGISMGNIGSDVAMETSDVVLMTDNIESIPFAIALGRRANTVIRQNIVFAIAVALTLITLNFIGGVINLPEGVIGHEGSTVLVILSGLRLLRFKGN